jgi:hypothetical protein
MTRSEPAADREALKEEIKQEMRSEAVRRKAIGWLGCLVLTAVIVLVPSLWVASLLAKTGFVEIPFLTDRLYRPAEPLRPVRPLSGSNAEQVMRVIISRASFEPASSTVAFTMDEQQLTTFAQGYLADPKSLPFRASAVQAAIDPEFVELHFISVRSRRNATVRVRFVPEVRGAAPDLVIKEVVIGSLRLPLWLAEYTVGVLNAGNEKAIAEVFSGIGTLQNIKLHEEELTMDILTPQK